MNYIKWFIVIILFLLSCIGFMALYSYPRWQSHQNIIPIDLPQATHLARCPNAPFVIPTDGWIGVVYGDSILGTFNHSGLDIFSPTGNKVTPVYAVYDGYVTRLSYWVSAVIIRHPRDPLNPNRQIWTYYAHMASLDGQSYIIDQIPQGTFELPVKQGTLLGYQGDYNGESWREITTHLHFSIVQDDDTGHFMNEMDRANTIDPSPYFGMRLNTACADRPPTCRPDITCE